MNIKDFMYDMYAWGISIGAMAMFTTGFFLVGMVSIPYKNDEVKRK